MTSPNSMKNGRIQAKELFPGELVWYEPDPRYPVAPRSLERHMGILMPAAFKNGKHLFRSDYQAFYPIISDWKLGADRKSPWRILPSRTSTGRSSTRDTPGGTSLHQKRGEQDKLSWTPTMLQHESFVAIEPALNIHNRCLYRLEQHGPQSPRSRLNEESYTKLYKRLNIFNQNLPQRLMQALPAAGNLKLKLPSTVTLPESQLRALLDDADKHAKGSQKGQQQKKSRECSKKKRKRNEATKAEAQRRQSYFLEQLVCRSQVGKAAHNEASKRRKH